MFFIILMVLSWREIFCTEHYKIVGKKIICNFNEHLIFNTTCYIKPGTRGHQYYGMEYVIKPNVQLTDIFISVTVLQRTEHSIKYKSFIGLNNITLDACALLNGKTTHTLFEIVLSELKRCGNIIHPCPLAGRIYVKDLIMNDIKIMPIVPFADYLVHVTFYKPISRHASEYFGDLKIFAEVKAP